MLVTATATATDPAGARARRRKAAEMDHGVYLTPVEPGTSEIRALMPTAHSEAVHQAVQVLAKDSRFQTADELHDLIRAASTASATIRRLVTDGAGRILDAERCECGHATSWDAGGCTDLANLGPPPPDTLEPPEDDPPPF